MSKPKVSCICCYGENLPYTEADMAETLQSLAGQAAVAKVRSSMWPDLLRITPPGSMPV